MGFHRVNYRLFKCRPSLYPPPPMGIDPTQKRLSFPQQTYGFDCSEVWRHLGRQHGSY